MKINSLFFLLPVEIIRDIFSRLPVDLVLQCKLVCKNWRDHIADHHGSRFNNSSSNIVEMGGCFLLQRPLEQRGFYYGEYVDDKVTCFNLTKKPVFNHDQYHCHFEDQMTREWYILASCNGLIWHGEHDDQHDDMYVSNPYTREYAKLPPLNCPPKLDVNTIYGFGYHPTTKEYKVIRICYENPSVGKGHAQVYTLGSGTPWRSIGEIEHEFYKYNIYRDSLGIILNGVLYWLTKIMKLIMSFDLEDEEFGVVPSTLPVFNGTVNALGVLSGCLCLSGWVIMRSLHVWVMNDNDYSWSEKFVISLNQCSRDYFPLAYLESGKVLLHQGFDKIVSYDPETEHFVDLGKNGMLDIIPYMKSSISLKALGEKGAIYTSDSSGRKQEQIEEKAGNREGAAAAEENRKKNKVIRRLRLRAS